MAQGIRHDRHLHDAPIGFVHVAYDMTGMGWMMALCMLIVIGVVVAIAYFAYKYGRMAQRLADQDNKPRQP